jgi:hypothetical protein
MGNAAVFDLRWLKPFKCTASQTELQVIFLRRKRVVANGLPRDSEGLGWGRGAMSDLQRLVNLGSARSSS